MVALWLATRLSAFALLTLSAISGTAADPGIHGIEEVQDLLYEAQHNATLQQELEPLFGYGGSRNEDLVNKNPLARANLFKRAGCTFYRTGDARTCITAGDICCTAGGGAQDGWCCPNTHGCGAGTGTTDKCTWRISWTTSTYYRTSYYTRYSTYTSTLGTSTVWTTRTWYRYTTVSSSMGTSTEWSTITSTTQQAGKRSVEPEVEPEEPTDSPTFVLAVPTPTVTHGQQKNQEVLQPKITEAPKYIQVRGLLIPRQTLRTDTSEWTVTRTSYITTTLASTTYRRSTYYTTYWTTSYLTRTAALGASSTVTSYTTLYLAAGETAPPSPQNPGSEFDDGGGGGGGGGGSRKKGFSSGAKAGVGVGVSLAVGLIVTIIGFFIRKHRAKKEGSDATVAGAQSTPDYKAPIQSPMGPPGSMATSTPPVGSDPRYSQLSHPHYGTPSPGPQPGYNPYQQQFAQPGMAMGNQQQQFMQPGVPSGASSPMVPPMQQYQYQYPRPLSPTYSGAQPSSPTSSMGMQQPQPMEMGMNNARAPPSEMPTVYSPPPSEMPTVYSPHPQRLQ